MGIGGVEKFRVVRTSGLLRFWGVIVGGREGVERWWEGCGYC